MKALTFKVRFFTAQYKEHTQKMTRRTYLIPPPSAVAGMFGAILGIERKKLLKMSEEMLAGAELKFLRGHIVTLARIFKIDRSLPKLLDLLRKYYRGVRDEDLIKDIQGLLTVKESEELYLPEYKFAIASHDEALIEEGLERLKKFDFEYDVFGGNDYHFVDFIGDPKLARVEKSVDGYGYCRSRDFKKISVESFNVTWDVKMLKDMQLPLIIPVIFLADVNDEFIQVYGAKIIAKRRLDVINDGESKIFVHKVKPFLVMQD